eukprot:Platyproteum_vivax@DN3041_c0_g1_i1.p1
MATIGIKRNFFEDDYTPSPKKRCQYGPSFCSPAAHSALNSSVGSSRVPLISCTNNRFSCEFENNLATIQSKFPSQPVGILTALLESCNNNLEETEVSVKKILQTETCTISNSCREEPNDISDEVMQSSSKRKRKISSSNLSKESIVHDWTDKLLGRLQNSTSQADAQVKTHLLLADLVTELGHFKPIIHPPPNPIAQVNSLNEKLSKAQSHNAVLTRAVKILCHKNQNLHAQVAQAQEMHTHMQSLQEQLQKSEQARNFLQYALTRSNPGCDFNQSGGPAVF